MELFMLSFLFCFHACLGEKRLLLTDLDVYGDRMSRLESLVHRQAGLIQNLTKQLEEQAELLASTFTQWGRTDCTGSNAELVYSGFFGGGGSGETGASPDFVCLPQDPSMRKVSGHDYGRMYGAEYNTDFWGGSTFYQNEIPCAVCRVKRAATNIMIPGKTSCSPGWNVEYHGNLGASHHTHTSGSSFICVDKEHQALPGGNGNVDGGRFLENVVAVCVSLRCPPYQNGDSFTCVVCSK